MAPYQYCPLDMRKQETRIPHFQPGGRDHPIRVTIEHVPFNHSEDSEPWRISDQYMKELQNNLPENWYVHQTVDLQYPIALHHIHSHIVPLPDHNYHIYHQKSCDIALHTSAHDARYTMQLDHHANILSFT
jgi:hypothetical protein